MGSGRSVIVAVDHGNTAGVVAGLENPVEVVKMVAHNGADGILVSPGILEQVVDVVENLAIVLRLAGLVLWVATLIYLIRPSAIAWASLPLADWLRWSGTLFGLAGAGMMYWTLTNLGKNLTDTVSTRRDATLVTSGPYQFVRHPFYVTAALLMLGASLLSANGLIFAGGLAAIVLLVVRTPKEEQKLVEKFGDQYRAYMARTGRFVPRIGR